MFADYKIIKCAAADCTSYSHLKLWGSVPSFVGVINCMLASTQTIWFAAVGGFAVCNAMEL